MMHVKNGNDTLALLPADFVARGPLIDRPKSKPEYLSQLPSSPPFENQSPLSEILLKLLSSPNIASKHWVFRQYDHEVGIRTVIKPGFDSSVLRLDNGKSLSVKIDGNPKLVRLIPDKVQSVALKKHVEMLFVPVQLLWAWLIIYNLVILKILKYFGHLWNL